MVGLSRVCDWLVRPLRVQSLEDPVECASKTVIHCRFSPIGQVYPIIAQEEEMVLAKLLVVPTYSHVVVVLDIYPFPVGG